jgi:hypothetical protein
VHRAAMTIPLNLNPTSLIYILSFSFHDNIIADLLTLEKLQGKILKDSLKARTCINIHNFVFVVLVVNKLTIFICIVNCFSLSIQKSEKSLKTDKLHPPMLSRLKRLNCTFKI